MAASFQRSSTPKLRPGGRIRISKQVSIDKENNYVLSVGEEFTAESVSPTGAVRITKTFSTGEVRKAVVSKSFYNRA